ncbi:MAG: hypothetical protein CVV30_11395 [Methanomicrobiales archaeon HGW-Methanomicrobiales-1]|nr:MAG: hypothetical protein CVV30_11395 [Methanomicrobiales archaeon HGW-Methanomicrobiales-1]
MLSFNLRSFVIILLWFLIFSWKIQTGFWSLSGLLIRENFNGSKGWLRILAWLYNHGPLGWYPRQTIEEDEDNLRI